MNNTPLEQRALELLAAEYEADGWKPKANDLRNRNLSPDNERAIRAISRALGEREIIVEWLREHFIGKSEYVRTVVADSIASGAHLKDMG